jgi:uncharacterized protein (DUF305 family)
MNNNQNNKIMYGIGGIVLGLLLALVFSPMMRWSGSMMSWGNNQAPSQRTAGVSATDRHFIEQMIPHHEGAVEMAKLALEKATHPEIKTLATAVIEAQNREIRDMEGWYRDWFGKSVPKGGSSIGGGMMSQSGMHTGGGEDINALKNASDFDKEFIEQMIPHHQMAIMMARMLESGTDRPEMQQLAKNIIKSQSEEIQKMQGWYQEWYR